MIERAGYFLSTEGHPRVRRARNAVQVVAGILLIAVTALSEVRLTGVQDSIVRVSESLPGWVEIVFRVGYGAAAVYALGMVLVAIVRVRSSPSTARDLGLAFSVAVGLAALVMLWHSGDWPRLSAEFGSEDPSHQFPMIRVAAVTAVVLALSPYVNRSLRRLGQFMVVIVALSGFALGFGVPTDAIAGMGVGMVSAGAVMLVFGSPSGFPDRSIVSSALAQLGIPIHDLEPAADQSWGTRRLEGRGADGTAIEIKAYGRDASDTQLAAKVWRSLWYRESGPDITFTRLQAVEHEALMAVFAARAGVNAAEPLTAGLAGDDVAIVAVPMPGILLADTDPGDISDGMLVDLWRDISRMHDSDLAHGFLNSRAIRVTDDGYLVTEFARASLAAGDRRHLDTVELLFSLSKLIGVERAVATAADGLGTDRLAAALPYLQLPAVSRAAKRDVTKPKDIMNALRGEITRLTEIDPPESVKLQRVTLGGLLMLALMLFAANVLITQLAGIDYAAVWVVLQNAAWIGIVIAFFFAHLVFIPEARSMEAAVGWPLPTRPLVILQLSARFIGVAVPSAAGRVAMNAAFLVKFGVSRTTAVTQGAIDGLSGFVVEACVLVIAFIFSDGSFTLDSDVDWSRILAIAVIVVLVGVALVFTLRRFRRILLPIVKDALRSVTGVFKDPRRALRLVFNNFLARLVFGATLWIILRSLGVGDISIAVAFTVTIATNLLAGLVPIPGGVGVAEAVLTSWLVVVGVPEATALAATVVYRMVTFYIPAVEGFFAMRWLEKRDYL